MNDYYHYWGIIKRSLVKVILLSAALSLLVFVITNRIGSSYEVHYSYIVSLSEREVAPDFRYDGYYALSSTDLFAATLTAWVQTTEAVVAAYELAGIERETDDAQELVQSVTANKTGPQIIEITVRHKEKAVAEKLSSGLQAVMLKNIEKYHAEGIPAMQFRVVTTESWTGEKKVATEVASMGTFIFSFLLGINGVLLVESFKRASL